MCGIIGYVGPDDAAASMVDHGVDDIRHRGPDASGVAQWRFADVTCRVAHTRLRIVDLSEEADQPLSNEDGSVCVVFNGEIYNHQELRSDLEAHGHRFASTSDTEVIVHLYEEL